MSSRCADLANVMDGRRGEVAGITLVRQKLGSAEGVQFITIESETGVANGILAIDAEDIAGVGRREAIAEASDGGQRPMATIVIV